ncbi:MAG TPA: hypothetical protein VF704_00200 [Allosphingosinicella sp.]|jgi:hypothetical protein
MTGAAMAAWLLAGAASGIGGGQTSSPVHALVALEEVAGGGGQGALRCTADRSRCARLRGGAGPGAWRLELTVAGAPTAAVAVPVLDDENAGYSVWPHLIVEAGGALLVGVQQSRAMSFSGGGSSATRLLLYRVEPGGGAALVLDVPVGGRGLYRACWRENDERRLGGACREEFEFDGELGLDPAPGGDRARLILTTRARTWPGPQRLGDDGGESAGAGEPGPPEQVWAPDAACSYRRVFAFSEAEGRYLPDQPLPTCEDYFNV